MRKRTFDPADVKRAQRRLARAETPPPPPRLSADEVILGELAAEIDAKRAAGWSWIDVARLLTRAGVAIPAQTIARCMRRREVDAQAPTGPDRHDGPNGQGQMRPAPGGNVAAFRPARSAASGSDPLSAIEGRHGLPHAGFREDV